MNRLRILLLCLGVCFCGLATAQWQWVDGSGRKVFSDRPPPADVAEKNILKRPNGAVARPAPAAAEPAAAARDAASAPRAAASLSRPSGKDADLDARKKELEAQEAAKKKADEELNRKAKQDSCQRARASKAALDSGQRMRTTNEKGETEFMSDEARAAENRRLQDVLKDCL